MSANRDNELNPPPEPSEEELHANCQECSSEWHVDDLIDGACPDCRPCGECDGKGCDECIEEVPKMPRAGIEVAMDKAAEAVDNLSSVATKHLIRETIAAHLNPDIKMLNDTIVGLATISTKAVAAYAIAAHALGSQDEIKKLKDSLSSMSVSNVYLLGNFIGHLGWEAEQKELRESNARLLEAAEEVRDMCGAHIKSGRKSPMALSDIGRILMPAIDAVKEVG